jgi:hypothetical protein
VGQSPELYEKGHFGALIQMLPVRKIGFGNRSITGKRPSQKTQGIHQFESTLERDYLTLLEVDEEVEKYVVQPVTIYYEVEGQTRRYTPDVAVFFKENLKRKDQLVEIKYADELIEKQEKYAARFEAAQHYARERDMVFVTLTEKEIRSDYLTNIKFLGRYLHTAIDAALSNLIHAFLCGHEILTPTSLLEAVPAQQKEEVLYTLWQMLAQKQLASNLHSKLTMLSKIWIS